jgi:N-acetylmuramoyl-L-alanine amidase
MRLGSTLFLMVLLISVAAPVRASGASPAIEQMRIAGKEYARLSDWARANDFILRWLKRDETIELSNSAHRIQLQIHSPDAQIDGVEVRLLFPLVQKGESVWMALQDLKSTFEPVLSPPRLRRGTALKTVCLDPGHGGKDPGFQVGSSKEKKFTLLFSQELQSQLKRAGWNVSLTRSRDTFVELPTRPDIARQRRADLFVSLHFNATQAAASTVKGVEVYCLTPPGAPSTNAGGEGGGAGWFAGNHYNDENMFLAYELQKTLTREVPVEDRGVHRARFWVLRDAVMPAVLIEAGFLSHPVEGRKISSSSYRRQLATAIVDGLDAYRRGVQRGAYLNSASVR